MHLPLVFIQAYICIDRLVVFDCGEGCHGCLDSADSPRRKIFRCGYIQSDDFHVTTFEDMPEKLNVCQKVLLRIPGEFHLQWLLIGIKDHEELWCPNVALWECSQVDMQEIMQYQ